jgi:hypothetical protein
MLRKEVIGSAVGSSCLRHFLVRLRFGSMNQIGKLDGI